MNSIYGQPFLGTAKMKVRAQFLFKRRRTLHFANDTIRGKLLKIKAVVGSVLPNFPLTPSTSKRVILYRFNSHPVEGIINPAESLQDDRLEMITTDGMLQRAPYAEVKALCVAATGTKPNLFTENYLFERRPKLAGLWVRFFLRDGDRIEGILSHNLLDWPDRGYWIIPPHAGPGRQRAFLPRSALRSTELLGVVGMHRSTKARRAQKPATPDGQQLTMFDD